MASCTIDQFEFMRTKHAYRVRDASLPLKYQGPIDLQSISKAEDGKERGEATGWRGEGRGGMEVLRRPEVDGWTPDRSRMCIFLFRPKSCILIRIVSVSLASDFDEIAKLCESARPTVGKRKRKRKGKKRNVYSVLSFSLFFCLSQRNFINGRDHLSIEFFRSSCFSKR